MTLDLAAVFLPLLGAMIAGLGGRRLGDRGAGFVTSGTVLFAALASIVIFHDVAFQGHARTHVLGPWIESGAFVAPWSLKIDTLTALMLVVVNIVSAMVHIYSIGYMQGDKCVPRFMVYLSLFTFFMLMLVASDNLIQMFFGWEGVGLMSYLLIGFWHERVAANEAAIKAFLMNRIGDIGFLLGIFGCFWLFESVQFDAMFKQAALVDMVFQFGNQSIPALSAICILFFVGAMGKSAQIGLHTWLPDAMEGPTPVSALIHAATMVAAGVFIVARLSPLFEYAPEAQTFVAIVGAVTAIFAASIGCTQFDIKRVLAYSTISQLGFMFFALGVSAYSAAMFHLTTHAFYKALLFLAAGSVIHALGGEQDMRKMGGLARSVPVTHAYMWVGILALAGIGIDGVFGFAGFYSKDMIVQAVLQSPAWYGGLLYDFGLAAAFMTAFYSLRLVLLVFFRGREPPRKAHESPWIMLGPLVPLALGAVFVGWIGARWFVPENLAFWRGALFVLPTDSASTALPLSYAQKVLPALVAMLGIALAYFVYVRRPEWPEKIAKKLGLVYRLVFNKYYVDEIYDFLFVRSMQKLAEILWRKGDDGLIDRFGPDGIAALAVRFGKRVTMLQTGYLYHYAFAIMAGLVVLLAWLWVRG